ncbi:MFS transporter [Sphingomonas parapaucimobilis]|nr:MFS transporter [Sphingomonas parapaucimobilis]
MEKQARHAGCPGDWGSDRGIRPELEDRAVAVSRGLDNRSIPIHLAYVFGPSLTGPLLAGKGLLAPDQAGLGYSVFAIAMTAGRLTGDRVVARIGDRQTMFWGGLLALMGYGIMLLAPVAVVAMLGLMLIGLGASNTVPVLFRQAGAQNAMPPELAVASITTVGYAGILAGPAAIGFVAGHTGLTAAFWMLAALLCLVPLCARAAVAKASA